MSQSRVFRRTHSLANLIRGRQFTHIACALALGGIGAPVVIPVSPAAAAAKKRRLGDRSLRVGTSGTDVQELQKLLTQIGYKNKVDGKFGSGTKKAVQRYQRVARMTASGAVGPKTIAAIKRAASGGDRTVSAAGGYGTSGHSSKSLGDRLPLRPGMSGHNVKVLQDFLTRAGFKTGIDGDFGNGTTRSVRRFETANKLPVDSSVDAPDVEVLRGQADAGKNADSAPAPLKLGPGDKATVGSDGLAVAPESAPQVVKDMIAAGNAIAKKPYIYGGGHAKFPEDKGYDCSSSVSYALWGGKLLKSPLVSGDFPNWGEKGPGQWVSIYGNAGHVYMVVAGLRFDTSGAKQDGSRWHKSSRPTKGYGVSHPKGY